MKRTARGGVLLWLRALVERAGPAGVVVTHSHVQNQGRAWMMAQGFESYSPNNLGRRLREIMEWDQLPSVGLRAHVLPAGHPRKPDTNEKAWLIQTISAPPASTKTTSTTSSPPPPSPPGPTTGPFPTAGRNPFAQIPRN